MYATDYVCVVECSQLCSVAAICRPVVQASLLFCACRCGALKG